MIAASRVYRNIRLSELQSVLQLHDQAQAERLLSKMIAEGRLAAEIDQTAGILTFHGHAYEGRGSDSSIARVCKEVDHCAALAARLM